MQVRLADIFGDNGMISVVICRPHAGDLEVDIWLMSCRVLGRRVETAVLQEILSHARRAAVGRIIGVYRPTERNGLVKDHYAKLGFRLVDREADGSTIWELVVADAPAEDVPLEIRRHVLSHA